jgi:hypothetical protein
MVSGELKLIGAAREFASFPRELAGELVDFLLLTLGQAAERPVGLVQGIRDRHPLVKKAFQLAPVLTGLLDDRARGGKAPLQGLAFGARRRSRPAAAAARARRLARVRRSARFGRDDSPGEIGVVGRPHGEPLASIARRAAQTPGLLLYYSVHSRVQETCPLPSVHSRRQQSGIMARSRRRGRPIRSPRR